jgi:hypothetical protein
MPKTFTTIGDKEQYATYICAGTLSANGMMMILHYQII